ncbi:protein cornichon homolog 4 isoform X2 [Eurytemora carolleeae]|uniref:protein cornichon homolog 4 isoform X2 n=1 Tax=Eurytemora carolleeae TaxID=1294199 RepID=UPI000C78E4B9|nr:protein cornichon homolog 4 isoform X2 [Eurytemora carolleeae]|eukprot:XP_023345298.1 protein cornichon homolog 4-like isoform X2 [Eurytemora affinis]
MDSEYFYMICILVSSLLLFLTVYLMITLGDLESDYINSRDCAAKMNFWTLPRIGLQILHSVVLLCSGEWKILIISLPFSSWLVYRKLKQAPGHSGLYDPTEIHNRFYGISSGKFFPVHVYDCEYADRKPR